MKFEPATFRLLVRRSVFPKHRPEARIYVLLFKFVGLAYIIWNYNI